MRYTERERQLCQAYCAYLVFNEWDSEVFGERPESVVQQDLVTAPVLDSIETEVGKLKIEYHLIVNMLGYTKKAFMRIYFDMLINKVGDWFVYDHPLISELLALVIAMTLISILLLRIFPAGTI